MSIIINIGKNSVTDYVITTGESFYRILLQKDLFSKTRSEARITMAVLPLKDGVKMKPIKKQWNKVTAPFADLRDGF